MKICANQVAPDDSIQRSVFLRYNHNGDSLNREMEELQVLQERDVQSSDCVGKHQSSYQLITQVVAETVGGTFLQWSG